MPSASKSRRDAARVIKKYDPLALENLQEILRERLERVKLESFPPEDFLGAGVYALYYVGDFDLYKLLKKSDCRVPIYVGKAEAGNSSYGEPAKSDGFQLIERIKKHATSVGQASENLKTSDFRVRFLPIDDAWIVLAERALLRTYRPVVWNTVMPGFGANAPGSDRQNARSIWDTIHPGRDRAGRLCNRRFTLGEMRERVRLAVTESVLEDETKRENALKELKAYRQRPIWRPRRDQEKGPKLVIQDPERFFAEMERLGLEVPKDHRVVNDELVPDADPEALAEENTMIAEQLDFQLDTEDDAALA